MRSRRYLGLLISDPIVKVFTIGGDILYLLGSLLCTTANAQWTCGTDLLHDHYMKNDSVYNRTYQKFQQDFYVAHNNPKHDRDIYNIPVVVHVIHLGEAVGMGSNISDTTAVRLKIEQNQLVRINQGQTA